MTDTPQTLFTAATAAHQAGRLDEAAGLYRRILAVSRLYPDVLHLLGLIEHQAGAHVSAASLIREAIILEPKHPVYHSNLASALIELGDFAGAQAAARRAIALKPDYVQGHTNLGTAHLRAGDLAAAGDAFRCAVALSPDNAIAHYWLGRSLQDQERFAEAAASYRTVVALAPGFADAHCNLGYALQMMSRSEDAARCCRQAIALSPTYADAHNNLGYILASLGDFDAARASYEQALAHDPVYAAAYNNLGNLYKDIGDLDRAAVAYRKALSIQPDFARVHFNLADIKTFRARDDDFRALEKELARPKSSPVQARYLHFAMGKALEDLGAFEEAFAHFRTGNAIKRASVSYEEGKILGYLRDMADAYDDAALKRLAGAGAPSAVPIFIVGMPRSGSTLVEQILASHPRVLGGGERFDFDAALAAVVPEAPARERAAGLTHAQLRALGEDYLARLPVLEDGRAHVTDKMPANFMHAGLIHLALPNAKVIHVTRDPADTCVSCYAKLFETGQDFTYELGELGRYYVACRRVMDHWRAVLPAASFCEISYETLVSNLESETRRLLDFCGLDWDPACLAFHTTARAIQTASATQVRKPLYTSSIGRWKRYEGSIAPLLTELAKL